MTIRSDISINWNVTPRVILVDSDSTQLYLQDLYDTLRYLASQPNAIDKDEIVDASGKEPLGSGVLVGLTVTLLNARVAFKERTGPTYTQCDILGGNLVAVDNNKNEMSPVHPTSFTSITKTSSSSATISTMDLSKLLTTSQFLALK